MHSPSLREWVAKGLTLGSQELVKNAEIDELAEGPGVKTVESDTEKNQDGTPGTGANGTMPSVLPGFGLTSNSEHPSTQEAVEVDDAPRASKNEESDSNPLVSDFKNKAIICPHGKLDPEETRNITVISAVRL